MFKPLLKVLLIALLFTSILSISNYLLEFRILHSQNQYYRQQLENLLLNIKFDNDIFTTKKSIKSFVHLKYLGADSISEPVPMYLATYNNTPVAVILESIAPDGYNGDIKLLIAIQLKPKPSILKMRVLQHNETPGLGDLIELEKSNWLTQFYYKNLSKIFLSKHYYTNDSYKNNDNGIDSLTGATITSRAITHAANQALLLITNHPEIYD